MKNFKKVFALVMVLTLLIVPNIVKAEESDYVINSKLVTDTEEFKTLIEEYYNDNDNDYLFPIFVGTNKIDMKDYITIDYLDASQKDLFDYSYENGTITVKIKDKDLYDALKNNKDITAKSYPELFSRLEKYMIDVNNGEYQEGTIGLRVRIYIPNNLSRTMVDYIFKNGEPSILNLDVDHNTDEYYVGHDERGTYFELIYGGTLADYTVFTDDDGVDVPTWVIGRRNLGMSMNTWDGGYFIIRNYNENPELIYSYTTEYHDTYNDYVNDNYATLGFNYVYEVPQADLVGDQVSSLTDTNTGVSVKGNVSHSSLSVAPLDNKGEVYKELLEKLNGKKVIGAYEVKLEGEYSGKYVISFKVDEKYNDRVATVLHKKNDGSIETFESKIEGGYLSVEVSEFSPFIIALNDSVIDSTPTLGVPSYVGFASILVLLSGLGLVKVLKKD